MDAIERRTDAIDRWQRSRVVCRTREAGYTLAEIMVVLMIISILSVLALGIVDGRIEKARLARCMIELRTIQSTVFAHSGGGWPLPDQDTFWDVAWSGVKPGPYYYMVDGDPNKGHGNDIDGIDEDNPGKSGGNLDAKDIQFVILCQHDHGSLGWYVYVEDQDWPIVATASDNPGYHRFIKWIDNPPGGGSGGGGPSPGG
jgi:prepilin-type N-terminal cleavage/methylation domain-containing protein